jgi:hypothetical protein
VPTALLEVRELEPCPEAIVAPTLPGYDPGHDSLGIEPERVACAIKLTRREKAHLHFITDLRLPRARDQHPTRRQIDDVLA